LTTSCPSSGAVFTPWGISLSLGVGQAVQARLRRRRWARSQSSFRSSQDSGDHQLGDHARDAGAQAKFAVLTGLFGVFAGAIGLMADLPTLARM
jgi:hypothetical protein